MDLESDVVDKYGFTLIPFNNEYWAISKETGALLRWDVIDTFDNPVDILRQIYNQFGFYEYKCDAFKCLYHEGRGRTGSDIYDGYGEYRCLCYDEIIDPTISKTYVNIKRILRKKINNEQSCYGIYYDKNDPDIKYGYCYFDYNNTFIDYIIKYKIFDLFHKYSRIFCDIKLYYLDRILTPINIEFLIEWEQIYYDTIKLCGWGYGCCSLLETCIALTNKHDLAYDMIKKYKYNLNLCKNKTKFDWIQFIDKQDISYTLCKSEIGFEIYKILINNIIYNAPIDYRYNHSKYNIFDCICQQFYILSMSRVKQYVDNIRLDQAIRDQIIINLKKIIYYIIDLMNVNIVDSSYKYIHKCYGMLYTNYTESYSCSTHRKYDYASRDYIKTSSCIYVSSAYDVIYKSGQYDLAVRIRSEMARQRRWHAIVLNYVSICDYV